MRRQKNTIGMKPAVCGKPPLAQASRGNKILTPKKPHFITNIGWDTKLQRTVELPVELPVTESHTPWKLHLLCLRRHVNGHLHAIKPPKAAVLARLPFDHHDAIKMHKGHRDGKRFIRAKARGVMSGRHFVDSVRIFTVRT